MRLDGCSEVLKFMFPKQIIFGYELVVIWLKMINSKHKRYIGRYFLFHLLKSLYHILLFDGCMIGRKQNEFIFRILIENKIEVGMMMKFIDSNDTFIFDFSQVEIHYRRSCAKDKASFATKQMLQRNILFQ